MKIYSPKEVLIYLKTITKDTYDTDLAKRLKVCKQSLSQYKHKNSIDVQLRIISLLIHQMDRKHDNKD